MLIGDYDFPEIQVFCVAIRGCVWYHKDDGGYRCEATNINSMETKMTYSTKSKLLSTILRGVTLATESGAILGEAYYRPHPSIIDDIATH
jgi:hypothetical protein